VAVVVAIKPVASSMAVLVAEDTMRTGGFGGGRRGRRGHGGFGGGYGSHGYGNNNAPGFSGGRGYQGGFDAYEATSMGSGHAGTSNVVGHGAAPTQPQQVQHEATGKANLLPGTSTGVTGSAVTCNE